MELNTKIANKFIIGPKIGGGSFGDIHLATIEGSEVILALKKEDEKSKYPQLLAESKILKTLQGGTGIMNVHWSGVENKNNYMIIDLLGPNI